MGLKDVFNFSSLEKNTRPLESLPVGVKRRSRYRGPVKFFKEKEQGEFNQDTLLDHTCSIGDDPLILP